MDHRSLLSRIRSAWRRKLIDIVLQAFVWETYAHEFLMSAKPRQLIAPAMLAQVLIVLFSMQSSSAVLRISVANLVLVGFVLLPMTMRKKKYHWVGTE